MKKLTAAAVMVALSLPAMANDAPDMGSPTEVYNYLGLSYGNFGANLKGMRALSEDKGEYDQKTGILFEVKNIFNEKDKNPKFSGLDPATGQPTFDDEADNRSYRLRYGTVNTKNGLGFSVDAVLADHPFYGTMSVIQAGPVATIPVGDSLLIWPILYAGGVIVEDNTEQFAVTPGQVVGQRMQSEGVDIASTIATAMMYVKWSITDNIWMLSSYQYTTELSGKSWEDDIADGGLQLQAGVVEVSFAYQLTPKQNIRAYYTDASDDDRYWVEFNYAF
ncbi:hypothetical protein [Ferrimonas senticii]|uniref:hypothetical protein n=1 Tax=Ferrimonas senticii TaxID=394566 RepID=UPI001F0AFD8E|nr:hypothetical protein [Ferrimonas senticii]